MKYANRMTASIAAFVYCCVIACSVQASDKPAPTPSSPRTIQVSNKTDADIWVGITTAAVSCATTPAGGSDLLCPTQAKGSCGNGGITCIGGLNQVNSGWCGSYPWNSTTGYCYQMEPGVANANKAKPTSLHLKPKGTLTLTAPKGSPKHMPFIWSGNLFARTGCSIATGTCQMGDCGASATNKNKDPGGMCPPGSGGSPSGTLGEITLANPSYVAPAGAAQLGPDYYDVSIINGVNVAAIVSPINGKTDPTAPYTCTAAGSTVAQGVLPACNWSIKPVYNNTDYSSYLRNVALPAAITPQTKQTPIPAKAQCPSPTSGGNPIPPNSSNFCQCPGSTASNLLYPNSEGYCPSPGNGSVYPNQQGYFATCDNNTTYPDSYGYCTCSSSSQCNAGQACGVAMNASANQYTQTCGTFTGWTTVDTLCSNNQGVNTTPFLKTLCNKSDASGTVTNYLGCTGSAAASTSCYNNATTAGGYEKTCCGCGTSAASQKAYPGVWPTAQTGSGADNGCYGNNTDWNTYIQPTLVYLKQACPTAYVYPFDDATSTFTCNATTAKTKAKTKAWPNYQVIFQSLPATP